MLLVGSKALKHWLPMSRHGLDFDMIATKAEFENFMALNESQISLHRSKADGSKHGFRVGKKPVEIEIIEPGKSNEILVNLATGPMTSLFGCDVQIADPAVLLAVKKSHLNLPLNWWKHIMDYHKLKALNPVMTDAHNKAWAMRRIEAETRWGKMLKPNLMVSNEEFFGKSQRVINRTFIHDDLHFSTCFYERPLYEKLKTDQTLAWCDKKLFEALSHGDKIKCVQEEAFSIALERKVIPAMNENQEYSAEFAFRYAVERIGTTLTSGWFREFTQENVLAISEHGVDYVGKFLSYIDKKGQQ